MQSDHQSQFKIDPLIFNTLNQSFEQDDLRLELLNQVTDLDEHNTITPWNFVVKKKHKLKSVSTNTTQRNIFRNILDLKRPSLQNTTYIQPFLVKKVNLSLDYKSNQHQSSLFEKKQRHSSLIKSFHTNYFNQKMEAEAISQRSKQLFNQSASKYSTYKGDMFQKEAEQIYKLFEHSNFFLNYTQPIEKQIFKPINTDQLESLKKKTKKKMLLKNANRFIKPQIFSRDQGSVLKNQNKISFFQIRSLPSNKT